MRKSASKMVKRHPESVSPMKSMLQKKGDCSMKDSGTCMSNTDCQEIEN